MQNFRDAVKAKVPPTLPEECVDVAISIYEQIGRTDSPGHVRECIENTGKIASIRRPDNTAGGQQLYLPPTPETWLRSDLLAKEIEPEVKEIRNRIGCPSFTSYKDAIAWLEDMSIPPLTQEVIHKATRMEDEIRDEIAPKVRLWEEMTGAHLVVWPQFSTLFYAKPRPTWNEKDEKATRTAIACCLSSDQTEMIEGRIGIRNNSQLFPLYEASNRLAENTNFSNYSIVAYIIANIKPVLVPVTINTVFSKNPKASIELLSPEMGIDLWKEIYKIIRRSWHVEKKKRLNDLDKRLFDIVECLGGLTQQTPILKEFWEQVRDVWNQSASERERHGDWRATRRRCKRLERKLSTEQKRKGS